MIIASAVLAALPALADAPATLSFSHAGSTVTMPMPSKYCLPQGDRQNEFANSLKADDTRSFIYLVLMPCGEATGAYPDSFFVIKAPNSGQYMMTPFSRAALIAKLSAFFAARPDLVAAMNAQAGARASEKASRDAGTKVEMSQSAGPLGNDQDCLYVGGSLTIKANGETLPLVVAECATAVNDHLISVFQYRANADLSALPAMLAEVRRVAMTMKGAADK